MAVATAAAAAAGVPVAVAALSYRFVPKRVCFSFAAYAKSVIYHLASCDVPVLEGLTAAEFDCLESAFSFAFPPDLREILQEGLPGRCLIKEVSRSDFWCDAWGERPSGRDRAVELAERFLEEAPALVPIYRNCYIPASPNAVGNPVFYIDGGDVRVLSFDLAGFFQEFEWLRIGVFRPAGKLPPMIVTPAWAATAPRRIEFWSDVAEKGGRRAPAPAPEPARVSTGGWWSAGGGGGGGELGACLDEAFWRLRDGGWREEEVREMMGMGGCDGMVKVGGDVARSDGSVARHVTAWSLELLRAGWSREDVVESLGINVDEEREVGVCDPHDRG
ncbi:uncharacterized protein LOC120288426 [Eucalyptus grandis]|uniref:uncharacterized protein LOC120288426 n=1 Tax=Eucalyptus grandis TaxID=71139 RepID=UPI00192EF44D|nr:uncharacterized protein LOC120288426 [Eucalyptus grandis]